MERLKGTAAVICEFNPFHYGHRHLLTEAKKKYATVFGIMSGNLIQRGGNACCDKYFRAAAAVECGFDGVLELPFPFSSLSARDFARAGVYIAEKTGIETLFFGAEDVEAVTQAKDIVCADSYEQEISEYIKREKNLSYPKAAEAVLARHLGAEKAKSLSRPNNILAIEYIKAASKSGVLNIDIIKRAEIFASAGSIRYLGVPTEKLPSEARPFFEKVIPDGSVLPFAAVAAKLYTGDKAMLYGIDESLAGRITKACREAGDYKELLEACKGANETDARIRRAFLSILFGITKYQAAEMPTYTLLLAANKETTPVVKKMAKQSEITLCAKPYDLVGNKQFENSLRAERVLRQIMNLPDPLRRIPYIKGEKQ